MKYDLAGFSGTPRGLGVYANYAYMDASILKEGANKGNQIEAQRRFRHRLQVGAWKAGSDGSYQSSQFAHNQNTVTENAAGNAARIPGYVLRVLSGSYALGPAFNNITIGAGIMNLLDRRYYTRSFDDDNNGLYVGQPRTVVVQAPARS